VRQSEYDEVMKRICRRLLEYDPDIVEIVQFGSSVYAPDLCRDVDILVITRRLRDYEGYLDAVYSEDPPLGVDVIVVEVGKKLKEGFLRGVLGSFRILYGDGRYLLEYAGRLGDPTFEEARSSLRVASMLLKLALETENPLDRDRLIREAFDALFHAARIAAMTYLSTEVSRWGVIRRMLPEPYRSEFREFIHTLHIKYFYRGEYPEDAVVEEFEKWRKGVEEFIRALEERTGKSTSKNC